VGSDVHVEAAEVRAAAPRFGQAADDIADALQTLRGALDGLGAFWGDDEHGAEFGAAYQPQADRLLAALGPVADGVRSIEPALVASANGYEHTDKSVTGRFTAR
jgi:uncharacterized protein YukE